MRRLRSGVQECLGHAFCGAKVAHLGKLPQGEAERKDRVLAMVEQMDAEEFGACSNTYACEVECPKRFR